MKTDENKVRESINSIHVLSSDISKQRTQLGNTQICKENKINDLGKMFENVPIIDREGFSFFIDDALYKIKRISPGKYELFEYNGDGFYII